MLHGIVKELEHWLLVIFGLHLIRQLLLQSLRLLSDLFQLRLQLYILFTKIGDQIVFLLVVDDEVGYFPLILRYKKLLRLNLLPEVIFNGFIGVLVEDELAEYLLILEVLLLVVL